MPAQPTAAGGAAEEPRASPQGERAQPEEGRAAGGEGVPVDPSDAALLDVVARFEDAMAKKDIDGACNKVWGVGLGTCSLLFCFSWRGLSVGQSPARVRLAHTHPTPTRPPTHKNTHTQHTAALAELAPNVTWHADLITLRQDIHGVGALRAYLEAYPAAYEYTHRPLGRCADGASGFAFSLSIDQGA